MNTAPRLHRARLAASLGLGLLAAACAHAPERAVHEHAPPRTLAEPDRAPDQSTMDHSTMDHSTMDHSTMDHSTMDHASMDHSTMDHSTMEHSTMDHASMDHPTMDHSTMDHATMDHATMDHATMGHAGHATDPKRPRTPIPALTAADRAAAFPALHGHAAHDDQVHWYWEFDQLETGDSDSGTSLGWETRAWIGKDTRRLWLRTRGERVDGRLVHAGVELLGSRSVSAWWDVVAGVRHDTGEGPSRSFAAIGVQGLAPYKIDVEATAYLGDGGRTAARVEAGYDTLLTNRLVLQWDVEADVLGRDDPQRRLGAGLSSLEAGARLRYEVTRQFAPYLGVVHERSFGRTADFRRDDGAPTDDTRVVAGVRLWF